MKIELATIDDAEEILAIYAPYVLNTAITFEYTVPTIEDFRGRIKTVLEKYPYLKAVNEAGEIVGYAYVSPFKTRAAYSWSVETSIYVKQDCKHNGIGRALYNQLEECCKKIGILNMNACIAYAKVEDKYLSNDSVKFHEKLGYKLVGAFNDCACKFDTWYNMVWMEKMIGNHTIPAPDLKFGNYLF